jgi:hypothetical protein
MSPTDRILKNLFESPLILIHEFWLLLHGFSVYDEKNFGVVSKIMSEIGSNTAYV